MAGNLLLGQQTTHRSRTDEHGIPPHPNLATELLLDSRLNSADVAGGARYAAALIAII